MQLDKSQASAVSSSGNTLVIAGPGSGKTRVLVAKAIRILRETNSRVMIVTFTKKAATTLVNRLKPHATKLQMKRLQIGTFHALIIKHLEINGLIGQLVGPESGNNLLQLAYDAAKCEIPFDEFINFVDQLHSHTISELPSECERAYEIYLQKLERHKAIDLGRVIKLAIDYMRKGELSPLPVNEMFIDEFQDIDKQQLEWVLRHAMNKTNITAVGDDDQSIYKFRNAMGYDAFKVIEKKLNARYVRMGTNYRSYSEIVTSATALIECNEARISKIYHAQKGVGGRIGVSVFDSVEAEQDAIIDAIQTNPNEWAVISRTNYRLKELEKRLSGWGIPFISNGKSNFWEFSPVKDLVGLLTHIVRSDPISVNNALSLTAIKHDVVDEWIDFRAKEKNKALPYTLCKSLNKSEIKSLVTIDTIMCNGFALTKTEPEKIIKNVASWLSHFYRGDDDKKVAARGRLFTAMDSLVKLRGDLGKRLRTITESNRNDIEGGGVQLLTMHSSKGLEFKKVWLMAVEEGVIPHPKLAMSMEEERRLLFVGMTRAEEERMISAVHSGKSSPSRFLYEARLLEDDSAVAV